MLSRIINGSRASSSRLTFVPFSRLSAAYAHFRWGVSGNNIILSRSFKGRPTRYLLMAGKRGPGGGGVPPGLAKPRYVGEGNGLAKILLTGQRAVGIFRPVWLFRFAISSVSSFRIVCRSASSFDVLRSRWYRRMFSSCTKSCKFITCFSVSLLGRQLCSFQVRVTRPQTSVGPLSQRSGSDAQHVGPPRLPSQTIHARSDRSGSTNGQRTQAWTETARDPFGIGSESRVLFPGIGS